MNTTNYKNLTKVIERIINRCDQDDQYKQKQIFMLKMLL